MPKIARNKIRERVQKARRKEIAVPLADEIMAAKNPGKLRPLKEHHSMNEIGDDDDDVVMEDGSEFLDASTSKKILDVVQEQQRDISGKSTAASRTAARLMKLKDSEDLRDDNDDTLDLLVDVDGGDIDVQMSAEDERALNMFMPSATPVRQTLADIIMAKIHEKEAADSLGASGALQNKLDPKVVQVYQHVGACMEKYRSGKVPKAFKVIPTLRNWEEVLNLTVPDKWSPQATYVATKLFASNLNPKMAQRYYNLVLLPKIVDDIDRHKRLNYHLYQSVKKAIYKPAAFFKGLFLPLVEEGCSLRVAVIMASVLAKISIPAMHSGVALIKMAQMPFSAPVALFMKTLLNKKYALPYKVIDSLANYFVRFRHSHEKQTLPVIWQQNLLTFVQRYKNHFSVAQKNAIKTLVQHHFHHQITPEVRRELQATTN